MACRVGARLRVAQVLGTHSTGASKHRLCCSVMMSTKQCQAVTMPAHTTAPPSSHKVVEHVAVVQAKGCQPHVVTPARACS